MLTLAMFPLRHLCVVATLAALGCQDAAAPPAKVTQEQFQQQVLDATQPVVVGFVADDANEQQRLSRALRVVEAQSGPGRDVLTMNVGVNDWLRDKWNVRRTPLLIAFQGGREIDRDLGNCSEPDVSAWLSGLAARELAAAVEAVQVPERNLTTADFDAHMAQSKTPVLVDFWAPWCGPCRMLAPHLRILSGEYEGRLAIAKVNVDDEKELARRYVRGGLPLLVMFRDGVEVDRLEGAPPPHALREWVAAALNKAQQTEP